MTLAPTPLRSRFGRRLLLLFVGCAVLPVALVGTISYGHITRQLRGQSERRLQQANRAMGLALYQRLLLLDATVKSISPRLLHQLRDRTGGAGGAGLLNTGVDLLAGQRFTAVEFISAPSTIASGGSCTIPNACNW